jgi:hypothetical protein
MRIFEEKRIENERGNVNKKNRKTNSKTGENR